MFLCLRNAACKSSLIDLARALPTRPVSVISLSHSVKLSGWTKSMCPKVVLLSLTPLPYWLRVANGGQEATA
eukprot:gene2044-biopygen11254